MKKNKLVLVGSLFVVTLGVLITLFTVGIDQEGAYKKSELSFLEKTSIDDATAWMEARLRDPETGQKMSEAKLKMIEKAIKDMPAGKSLPLTWVEEGPDNIGGRTRAILVDRDNNSRVYAGSVSGGLYVSSNGGNAWTRVANFPGTSFISSMAQMQNGAIFVSTGLTPNTSDPMEGFLGNGIWYTVDDGATWTIVPGTASITEFAEIACADNSNKLWIASPTGLKTWDFGGASLNNVTTTSGPSFALQISKDGSLIVCAAGNANRTFVSMDGGNTFVDKSGNTGAVVPTNATRIEYAISATKNSSNKYTIYAIRTGNNLQGMNVSQDGGETWAQFYGAINPPSNVDIYRGQGRYNTVASVDPTNTKKLFVGGIDVWRWTQTVDSPPTGGIEPASLWSVNPTSSIYVHADNHEMKWDANNRLYVGNDGGVGISNTLGNTWYPANRGYNVTQFYGMAFDKNGAVVGGAQDNGTLYNDHTLSTYKEFREIGGGDGFHCAISFYNPSIIFSTVYNGDIYRSIDGGTNRSSFVPDYPASYGAVGTGAGFPFYNFIKLVEYYDTNSEDSLLYSPDQNYDAGDVVPVQSAATGNIINYVTPTALYYDEEVFFKPSLTQTRVSVQGTNGQNVLLGNLTYTPFPSASGNNPPAIGDSLMVNFPTGPSLIVVQSVGSYPWYFAQHPISGKIIELGSDQSALSVAWDTVTVQDPYQSWFVTYVNQNGGELWGTRDALRLSVVNPVWFPLVKNIGGTGQDIIDVEFSKDMNRMYVSAGSKVTRVDGLGSIYSSDPDFSTKAGYCCAPTYLTGPTGTTATTVSTGAVEGIALNPSNSNDLIIFQGAGVAKRSLNAGSASPTFTNLGAISGASSPFTYDGIIDRDDSDIIVIGTSHGVFVSDNGGSTWTQSSGEFDGTPVYMVLQSTRTYAEGNGIPGVIYIATHGRGIWKSSSLLGLKDDTKTDAENFKTKLKAFPNPTANSAALSFELLNAGTVTVNVYSITGSKVKTIVEKNMSSGYNTLDLDASDLPKGTYIVKFNSGGQSQTTKFVKM